MYWLLTPQTKHWFAQKVLHDTELWRCVTMLYLSITFAKNLEHNTIEVLSETRRLVFSTCSHIGWQKLINSTDTCGIVNLQLTVVQSWGEETYLLTEKTPRVSRVGLFDYDDHNRGWFWTPRRLPEGPRPDPVTATARGRLGASWAP